jgi:hypothetical protein
MRVGWELRLKELELFKGVYLGGGNNLDEDSNTGIVDNRR